MAAMGRPEFGHFAEVLCYLYVRHVPYAGIFHNGPRANGCVGVFAVTRVRRCADGASGFRYRPVSAYAESSTRDQEGTDAENLSKAQDPAFLRGFVGG